MSEMLDTEAGLMLDPKTITRDWLEVRLAKMIDEGEEVDPAENLLLYGLDSISVMRLTADLGQAGLKISFAELAQTPSLNAWWALISDRLPR